MSKLLKIFFIVPFLFLTNTDSYSQESNVQNLSSELDEIVVTARKREENIQDTALSVSALSARDIDNRVPNDIRDLAADSPNLIIDDLYILTVTNYLCHFNSSS